jgi:hypothetical protein
LSAVEAVVKAALSTVEPKLADLVKVREPLKAPVASPPN